MGSPALFQASQYSPVEKPCDAEKVPGASWWEDLGASAANKIVRGVLRPLRRPRALAAWGLNQDRRRHERVLALVTGGACDGRLAGSGEACGVMQLPGRPGNTEQDFIRKLSRNDLEGCDHTVR